MLGQLGNKSGVCGVWMERKAPPQKNGRLIIFIFFPFSFLDEAAFAACAAIAQGLAELVKCDTAPIHFLFGHG
jgi:hypothetical protein